MSVILHLTDKDGDPCLCPWDKVTWVEEVRAVPREGEEFRRFLRTKIYFLGGSPCSATVRETIPEILDLLNPPPQPPTEEQLESQRQTQRMIDEMMRIYR